MDIKILFDESHSNSWVSKLEKAKEINPDQPKNSSFELAISHLTRIGCEIAVSTTQENFLAGINNSDIVMIVHPCDDKWEKTTGGTPIFSDEELAALENHLNCRGSVFLITEYEYEKYGSNIEKLAEIFGIQLNNDTLRNTKDCENSNPTWVHGIQKDRSSGDFFFRIEKCCFYRSGSCASMNDEKKVTLPITTSSVINQDLGILGGVNTPSGRLLCLCDSDIFGDEYIEVYSHFQLLENCIRWLSAPIVKKFEANEKSVAEHKQDHLWTDLKDNVVGLRALQSAAGCVAEKFEIANNFIDSLVACLEKLSTKYQHQKDYFSALVEDFKAWKVDLSQKPDFSNSSNRWSPHKIRIDGLVQVVIFPLTTPNSSSEFKFEALLIETHFPEWLEELNDTQPNEAFVSASLIDYTDGYNSECAVLFPESISGDSTKDDYGIIFCNREATRFMKFVIRCFDELSLELPPIVEVMLSSESITKRAFIMWDFLHDNEHRKGHIPYDRIILKQRNPYWIYALEELRVDLATYKATQTIQSWLSEFVRFAIVFDRLFRFPFTQQRNRDYDGLAGQIIFGYLYKNEIIQTKDRKLKVQWDQLDSAMCKLGDLVEELYKKGNAMPKDVYWDLCYDFVSVYSPPCIGSNWKSGLKSANINDLLNNIEKDEFPLPVFLAGLKKDISDIIN